MYSLWTASFKWTYDDICCSTKRGIYFLFFHNVVCDMCRRLHGEHTFSPDLVKTVRLWILRWLQACAVSQLEFVWFMSEIFVTTCTGAHWMPLSSPTASLTWQEAAFHVTLFTVQFIRVQSRPTPVSRQTFIVLLFVFFFILFLCRWICFPCRCAAAVYSVKLEEARLLLVSVVTKSFVWQTDVCWF